MHTGKKLFIAVLTTIGCLVSSAQSAEPEGLGLGPKSAIEVCQPNGQRDYLARLVCPGGMHPTFERIGSMGMRNELPADMSEEEKEAKLMAALLGEADAGSVDYHIVDGYSVKCGTVERTLYLDMYHCAAPAPSLAPEGFTIIR